MPVIGVLQDRGQAASTGSNGDPFHVGPVLMYRHIWSL
jgi:hypothetical protein